MAIFLAHPAGESFFVYGRTFAAIMPLQTAVIFETFVTKVALVKRKIMTCSVVI